MLLRLLLLRPSVLEQQHPLLPLHQLHPRLPPHSRSARRRQAGLGPIRHHHLAHPLDLLSQPRLPRLRVLAPKPTLPLCLDSRQTPHLCSGVQQILHQKAGAFSLAVAVVLEPQTTLQVCLRLEQEPLAPLLLPPTLPLLPSQQPQEVDSLLTNLQRLIWGQINPSLPLQLDSKPSLGAR